MTPVAVIEAICVQAGRLAAGIGRLVSFEPSSAVSPLSDPSWTQLPKRLLPFIPSSLRVIAVTPEPERVTVVAVPRSAAARCPACSRRSDRGHGHYERLLADLPWQGRSVCLRVRLHRLRCRNPACPRRTFSQSLSDVAPSRARRSRRLQDVQRHRGLALGGAPAAGLAQRLALPAGLRAFTRASARP